MGVYIIQAGENGLVKIGWCKDHHPKKRIAVLQIGCPEQLDILYLIHPCARTFEGFLHKEFEKDWVRGEWFFYSQEIKDFIRWHSNLQREVAASRKRKRERAEEEAEERRFEREYEKHMQEQEDAYLAEYEKQQDEDYESYLKETSCLLA